MQNTAIDEDLHLGHDGADGIGRALGRLSGRQAISVTKEHKIRFSCPMSKRYGRYPLQQIGGGGKIKGASCSNCQRKWPPLGTKRRPDQESFLTPQKYHEQSNARRVRKGSYVKRFPAASRSQGAKDGIGCKAVHTVKRAFGTEITRT